MIVRSLLAVALTAASALAQDAPDLLKPVRVSGGVMAGSILKRVTPQGSPDWCLEHRSGTAVFHVIIGKDGKVKELTPVSGSAMMLAYVPDTLRQWEYRPYKVNGQPVEVETTITINISWGEPPPVDCKTPPALTLAARDIEGPVRVSGGVMNGMILTKVWPRDPEEARHAHVSGAVVLHLIIGKDGAVKGVTVVSGPEMLRAAYVDAVRQWKYRPYLLNGEPVEVDTTVTINH